jgi:hypothetical protein
MDQKAILNQIDSLLDDYNRIKSNAKYSDLSDQPKEDVTALVTRMVAAIERLSPPGSRYVENARQHNAARGANIGHILPSVLGIMKALRKDYEAGHLQSVTELIHADVFTDFLEMADHLLDQGYKDPAAVIAGSVLEEHIRKLCDKNTIPTVQNGKPKKADMMNADLANANIYSKGDQKSVTAWLDLRNKAAHGKYSEYTKDQIALLIQSIRDFITRIPA